MDYFSLLFIAAMVAVVASFGITFYGRRSPEAGRRAWRTAGQGGAMLAFGMTAGAGVLHLMLGHSAGTPNPLGATAFVAAHPSLLVMSSAAVLAWYLAARR